jgi:protein-L-isoaspartate(D-aspartate) O-methyltransferase
MFVVMVPDTFRHKGMRKRLAQIVRLKGISDERVIDAVGKVPRHAFLPELVFAEQAYEDKAFPIGEGQTISQPFTVAYQTELLNLRPSDRVLEIGTGSGYQAAILAEIAREVYTLERIQALNKEARDRLTDLGYKNVKFFHGDGNLGLPAFAPYDRILITAATPDVPQALLEQLAAGGVLVAPVGKKHLQQMVRITKQADGTLKTEHFDKFVFVPMLKGKS